MKSALMAMGYNRGMDKIIRFTSAVILSGAITVPMFVGNLDGQPHLDSQIENPVLPSFFANARERCQCACGLSIPRQR